MCGNRGNVRICAASGHSFFKIKPKKNKKTKKALDCSFFFPQRLFQQPRRKNWTTNPVFPSSDFALAFSVLSIFQWSTKIGIQCIIIIITFLSFWLCKKILYYWLWFHFWKKKYAQIVNTYGRTPKKNPKLTRSLEPWNADRSAFVNLTFEGRKAAWTNHGVIRAGTALNWSSVPWKRSLKWPIVGNRKYLEQQGNCRRQKEKKTGEKKEKKENLPPAVSPMLQVLPEYPCGQAQEYSSGSLFMQVPPLTHGWWRPQ